MNLFEINARIEAAFEKAVDMETGEITDEVAYAELDALQMEFGQKTENILLWIKNLNAEAEALKKQKQIFADRQSKAEKTAEFVGDVMTLPPECIRVKAPEVNKDALKKALKDGAEINGAVLVTKNNIQIK